MKSYWSSVIDILRGGIKLSGEFKWNMTVILIYQSLMSWSKFLQTFFFKTIDGCLSQVMLEKMALNLERKRLTESNHQLQKQLEHCLDTSPTIKRKLKSSLPSLVFPYFSHSIHIKIYDYASKTNFGRICW